LLDENKKFAEALVDYRGEDTEEVKHVYKIMKESNQQNMLRDLLRHVDPIKKDNLEAYFKKRKQRYSEDRTAETAEKFILSCHRLVMFYLTHPNGVDDANRTIKEIVNKTQ